VYETKVTHRRTLWLDIFETYGLFTVDNQLR